jgi:hypothetical protein
VYHIIDFVTTYNVSGEFPEFYRYCRDLNLNWNYKFGYHLLEQQKLVGKTLVNDADTVTVPDCVKPKDWKAEVIGYNNNCAARAIIADAAFANASVNVGIGSTNPNRMETTVSYKLTGVATQSATTVTQGFNFG